ncbi:hypothetical protein [Pseudooceanicola sp. HF7]|uniref:hypothetical protein n=1 Tax=Pseudooceanicola sp. HF7 TaxID=2721560 RepID=UPI001430E2AB|nr:hypothetical protein [Pseudooceanicola sp. HF7]NIZ08908.1 hypothetical protein [Pseudooceanicola sp. HF7]
MPTVLPNLYFRIRENGAFVFRVVKDERLRSLGLNQVAVANIRNGEIKPQGNEPLTDQEISEIRAWMESRKAVVADRQMDEVHRTVEALNRTAQWVQSRASEDELATMTDPLLMAMHDLRSALVRKQADILTRKEKS